MKLLKKTGLAFLILTLVAPFALSPIAYAATSPSLGQAASFSVLAETTITNVPNSVIGGDAGVSPASGSFNGLTDPQVAGTIYSVDAFGPAGSVVNPALLTNAVNDMMAAFTAVDQPCTTDYGNVVKELGGSNLGPGVYCAGTFALTGNLTLSGSGVWIFKSSATLTTAANSSITGGDPCNVWWRLVSAGSIMGTNSSFVGNVLAGTSVAMQTGASLNGRALAQAAVTLDHNTITGPVCATAASSSGTTSAKTPGLPNTGGSQKKSTPLLGIGAFLLGASLAAYLVQRQRKLTSKR